MNEIPTLALAAQRAMPVFTLTIGFILAFRTVRHTLGMGGVGALALALTCWIFEASPARSSPVDPLSAGSMLFRFTDELPSAIRSFLFGFTIGLPSAILFESIPLAGRLIDTVRGAQGAESLFPLGGHQHSALESAFLYAAVVAVAESGAHLDLLEVFRQRTVRFLAIPEGSMQIGDWIRASAEVFKISLLAAAPVLICVMLVDVTLAFSSRFFGKAAILCEASSVKVSIALIFVALMLQLKPNNSFVPAVALGLAAAAESDGGR